MYVMAEKIVQIIEHDPQEEIGDEKGFQSKAFRTIMLFMKYKDKKFYSVNTIRRNSNSNVHWKKGRKTGDMCCSHETTSSPIK